MKTRLMLALTAAAFLAGAATAFAEEGKKSPRWGGKRPLLEKMKETDPEKYKELMELKEKDPKAFEEKMQEVRQAWLEKLKTENPEKYEEIMKQVKAKLDARLEKLKAQNPELYKELQELREKDPAAFRNKLEELKQQKDAFAKKHQAWLEKLKTQNPELYKELQELKKDNPQAGKGKKQECTPGKTEKHKAKKHKKDSDESTE